MICKSALSSKVYKKMLSPNIASQYHLVRVLIIKLLYLNRIHKIVLKIKAQRANRPFKIKILQINRTTIRFKVIIFQWIRFKEEPPIQMCRYSKLLRSLVIMQQEQKRQPKIKSMTKTSILIIVINNVFCKHQVTDPVRKIKDKLKIINFSPQKNYMTLNNQTSICRSMIMSLLKRNSHISLKFRLKMERAFPINKMLSK